MLDLLLRLFYTIVLIAAAFFDLRERRIPNKVIAPALLLALVTMFYSPGWRPALTGGLLAASIFMVPVILLGPQKAGMGDVKLALFIGLILGVPLVLCALLLTFLAAALVVIGGLVSRRLHRHSTIPFAPFLASGALVCLFLMGG